MFVACSNDLVQRSETRIENKVCPQPPSDVIAKGYTLQVGADVLSNTFNLNISTDRQLQRIRTEIPQVRTMESVAYILCIAAANNLITPARFEDLLTRVLGAGSPTEDENGADEKQVYDLHFIAWLAPKYILGLIPKTAKPSLLAFRDYAKGDMMSSSTNGHKAAMKGELQLARLYRLHASVFEAIAKISGKPQKKGLDYWAHKMEQNTKSIDIHLEWVRPMEMLGQVDEFEAIRNEVKEALELGRKNSHKSAHGSDQAMRHAIISRLSQLDEQIQSAEDAIAVEMAHDYFLMTKSHAGYDGDSRMIRMLLARGCEIIRHLPAGWMQCYREIESSDGESWIDVSGVLEEFSKMDSRSESDIALRSGLLLLRAKKLIRDGNFKEALTNLINIEKASMRGEAVPFHVYGESLLTRAFVYSQLDNDAEAVKSSALGLEVLLRRYTSNHPAYLLWYLKRFKDSGFLPTMPTEEFFKRKALLDKYPFFSLLWDYDKLYSQLVASVTTEEPVLADIIAVEAAYHITFSPGFTPPHHDPRFGELLEKLRISTLAHPGRSPAILMRLTMEAGDHHLLDLNDIQSAVRIYESFACIPRVSIPASMQTSIQDMFSRFFWKVMEYEVYAKDDIGKTGLLGLVEVAWGRGYLAPGLLRGKGSRPTDEQRERMIPALRKLLPEATPEHFQDSLQPTHVCINN